jgi:N-acetyl-anhydromuramyl-L-alanine amidase AmpD
MMSMLIDTRLRLPKDQYIAEPSEKSLITIHNTGSLTAQSSFNYWASNIERVGTCYIVDRQPAIYEVFPPDCWAWGMKAGEANEKRAIQIEIVNAGPLKLVGDRLNWWPENFSRSLCKISDTDQYVKLDKPWRGYQYWHRYPDAQINAVADLVQQICTTFRIPKTTGNLGLGEVWGWQFLSTFKGIIGHHNIRFEKVDPGPHFPWDKVCAR